MDWRSWARRLPFVRDVAGAARHLEAIEPRVGALEGRAWRLERDRERDAARQDALASLAAEAAWLGAVARDLGWPAEQRRQADLHAATTAALGSSLPARLLVAHGRSPVHQPPPQSAVVAGQQEGQEILMSGFDRSMTDATVRGGGWARNELRVLLPLLRPGDRVLDVGSNVGTHALPFARAVGPAGQVLCIDPNATCVQILFENVRRAGLANVRAALLALSDRTTTLPLFTPFGNLGHGAIAQRAWPREATVDVPAWPGSAVVEAAGLRPLRLVKMDIQGHEEAALAGLWDVVAADRPLLFLEFDRGAESGTQRPGTRHVRRLEEAGYRVFVVDEVADGAIPVTLEELDAGVADRGTNLLFVPAGAAADLATVLRPPPPRPSGTA